ncbi:dTDP-4-dehydrorhamnose reductase [Priestia megaterium]|uniref:dTDP-4-dehydrorhamnose reductase n=1 Tax=Priestia megaterium TaxID=1404 RepID=UPI000BFC4FC6|nr:dTDP-4-dehydrorhamnose reductase [Priestia megaterium]MCM3018705.1 dTDP-4-dehydrorhamnose reductase [Priestia megaterium]PGY51867.1 dTDP-4-dehydrorhamnose reductase [Priestia megaterium]
MKILVTGYSGQLGYDVVRYGRTQGLNMLGISSKDVDLSLEKEVASYIEKIKPDAIIHCAAYTAVDRAEEEKEKCWDINVNGTKYLSNAAKSIKAKFMYISTDYVFNGEGNNPFKETDSPMPIGYYGKTKYEGEKLVQRILEEWFIVRISWVFGINGNNFVKTMLRLSDTHEKLNVVGDQIGSPTYTFDLAKLLIEMIQSNEYGVYHATNEGFCSWAQFAKEIFKESNKNVKVESILSEQYPTLAVRPKNSRMEKSKLVKKGFTPLPTWEDAVKRYMKELKLEVK